mgnify:CR=1 FL=1
MAVCWRVRAGALVGVVAVIESPRALERIAAIADGAAVPQTLAALEARLLAAGFRSIDYASLADADTLEPLDNAPLRPARLLVAARIGTTRLIDNMAVAPASGEPS